MSRPPLGIIPRRFWDETRYSALQDAMRRYIAAGFVIPEAWVDEHNELEAKLGGDHTPYRCRTRAAPPPESDGCTHQWEPAEKYAEVGPGAWFCVKCKEYCNV